MIWMRMGTIQRQGRTVVEFSDELESVENGCFAREVRESRHNIFNRFPVYVM
jgi:hypothetical protein